MTSCNARPQVHQSMLSLSNETSWDTEDSSDLVDTYQWKIDRPLGAESTQKTLRGSLFSTGRGTAMRALDRQNRALENTYRLTKVLDICG